MAGPTITKPIADEADTPEYRARLQARIDGGDRQAWLTLANLRMRDFAHDRLMRPHDATRATPIEVKE